MLTKINMESNKELFEDVIVKLSDSIKSMSRLADILDNIRQDKAKEVRGAVLMLVEWEKEIGEELSGTC